MTIALSTLFVGLLCLALAVHPYLTYPLSLALRRRVRADAPATDAAAPTTADIVFCAYNEERSIAAKLDNMISLLEADPELQVRIYLDGCEDATPQIVARHEHPRLHVIEATERGGKSRGINALVAASDAEVIIFTDANVILDDDVVDAARQSFRDPDIGCLCGHLIYVNPDESQTAGLGALYWRIEEAIKQLESDTGSTMGADGSLFAIRRALFTPVAEDIIDDFHTSMNVLLRGKRVVRIDSMRAYERSVSVRDEEFRRKVRIACRAFNCHRHLQPRLRQMSAWNRYKYYSHKVLRWLTIYFLGAGVLFVLAAAMMLAGDRWPVPLLVLLGAIAAVLAGHRWRIPGLSAIAEVLSMFLAAGVGVWESLRGKRYRTWTVAASSRHPDVG